MFRLLTASLLLLFLTACSKAPQHSVPEGFTVLATVQGDLDGDNHPEAIRLVGRPAMPDSPFQEDLSLLVGTTLWPMPTAAASGYEPMLKVLDITGDGRDEVLVVASTGGSGGMVNAAVMQASPAHRQWRFHTIFDSQSNLVPRFSGSFEDGFTAHLIVESPGGHREIATIDLAGRLDQYLEIKVYDAAGSLLKPVDIWGAGLMGLEPVINDSGPRGLRLTQQARGASNADRLAVITTVITYQGDTWSTTSLEITPVD